METAHEFEFLRQWEMLSDSNIRKVISPDTITILSRVIEMLAANPSDHIVRENSFASIVHQMHSLMVKGSRLLGDTIIVASELRDAGKIKEAQKAYQDFLATCESNFYKNIANAQLRKLL